VVRVNHSVLTVDQAIACIDSLWDEAPIANRLVNVCLVQEELERNPVDVSDQELQLAMDGFRRTRKLYKAEDTYRWMERRGVSYQELERLATSHATIAKLRDKLVASRVQDYFDANSADFDTVYVAKFALPDELSARESFDRIRSGDIEFFEAAQSHFISARSSLSTTVEFFSTVQRRHAPVEIRDSLFHAIPGALLGPVREGETYAIFRVLEIRCANLNDATRDDIMAILFEEWLAERRRAATIEWFWGNAANTARSSRTDGTITFLNQGKRK
jgi:putative peptide maturation system protein